MCVAESIQSPCTVTVTVSLANQQNSSGRAVATWMTKLDTRQAHIRLYYPTAGPKVSWLHSIKRPPALTALRGKGLIELDHRRNLA